MIRPAPLNALKDQFEFVPQAVVAQAIAPLADRAGLELESGHDDFDEYWGFAAWLDELPFTLLHYKGHPKDTSTIYLPFEISDVMKVTNIISRLVLELKLGQSITWQRKDGLSLP